MTEDASPELTAAVDAFIAAIENDLATAYREATRRGLSVDDIVAIPTDDDGQHVIAIFVRDHLPSESTIMQQIRASEAQHRGLLPVVMWATPGSAAALVWMKAIPLAIGGSA